MVAMLANGAAGGNDVDFHSGAASQSADFIAIQQTLIEFMSDMAKLVVRDGEGATKFITIRVRGSPSYPAAKHIASVIRAPSSLRYAFTARILNWGGVLAALGYSLVDTQFAGKGVIVPELTSVSFVPLDGRSELRFLNKGSPAKVDEMKANEIMEQEDVEVLVDLRDRERERILKRRLIVLVI